MGSACLATTQVTPQSPNVFKLVELPQQKVYNGVPFPLIVSPTDSSVSLAESVRAHKPWLETKLHEVGAVLFRGFDVPTATIFDDVLGGFGYESFPFLGLAAPRSHVVGSVYTANDSPPHLLLHFHNEMAYLKEYPSKAFFHCEVEPRSRGETPIVLGHVVYKRLAKMHSEFLHRLEEHGFVYHKVLPNETDPSSPIGQSWKYTFSTDDKAIAEQRAAKVGLKLKWLENGVRLSMPPVPGIKIDKTRVEERKLWFNSLMAVQESQGQGDPRYKLENPVILGDGTPIPREVVEDCRVILNEECVAIPWRSTRRHTHARQLGSPACSSSLHSPSSCARGLYQVTMGGIMLDIAYVLGVS